MSRRLEYAVRPWLVAVLLGAGVVLFAVAVDARWPERFLFAVPAVVVWVEALRSSVLRPTLRADDAGIEVVVGLRRERHPWSAVEAIGVMGPPSSGGRFRRRANALEIDLGERLVMLPAYRLGASAQDVAAEISSTFGNGGGF